MHHDRLSRALRAALKRATRALRPVRKPIKTVETKRIITIPPSTDDELDNLITGVLRIEVTTTNRDSAWVETNGRAVGIALGSSEDLVLNTICSVLMEMQMAGVDCTREDILRSIRNAFTVAMAGLHPHPADIGMMEGEDPHGLPL
jgi:hypothetical protein